MSTPASGSRPGYGLARFWNRQVIALIVFITPPRSSQYEWISSSNTGRVSFSARIP